MKTLWAFEPFHQDKERLQGMHSLLKQLGTSDKDLEALFLVTRHGFQRFVMGSFAETAIHHSPVSLSATALAAR